MHCIDKTSLYYEYKFSKANCSWCKTLLYSSSYCLVFFDFSSIYMYLVALWFEAYFSFFLVYSIMLVISFFFNIIFCLLQYPCCFLLLLKIYSIYVFSVFFPVNILILIMLWVYLYPCVLFLGYSIKWFFWDLFSISISCLLYLWFSGIMLISLLLFVMLITFIIMTCDLMWLSVCY